MKVITALLVNLGILTIVTWSGHAVWASNISIGLYITLACISVLALYINPELKPEGLLPSRLNTIFKIYVVVVFVIYGFWIRAILAAIFGICINHGGSLYKPEPGEGEKKNYERRYN